MEICAREKKKKKKINNHQSSGKKADGDPKTWAIWLQDSPNEVVVAEEHPSGALEEEQHPCT